MALFLSLHSFANEALSEIDVLRAQLANEKSKNSPIYIKTRQKLDKLINNGGKITAVLGANSNGYEGFYNRDDVLKLDLNVGGPKRWLNYMTF